MAAEKVEMVMLLERDVTSPALRWPDGLCRSAKTTPLLHLSSLDDRGYEAGEAKV
jgi:hypothetical protein